MVFVRKKNPNPNQAKERTLKQLESAWLAFLVWCIIFTLGKKVRSVYRAALTLLSQRSKSGRPAINNRSGSAALCVGAMDICLLYFYWKSDEQRKSLDGFFGDSKLERPRVGCLLLLNSSSLEARCKIDVQNTDTNNSVSETTAGTNSPTVLGRADLERERQRMDGWSRVSRSRRTPNAEQLRGLKRVQRSSRCTHPRTHTHSHQQGKMFVVGWVVVGSSSNRQQTDTHCSTPQQHTPQYWGPNIRASTKAKASKSIMTGR